MRLALTCAVLALSTLPALADNDRPVTDAEHVKIEEVMKAQSCSGGYWKFDDDGYFDIDNARCADGRVYDLKFTKDYQLMSKKLDD